MTVLTFVGVNAVKRINSRCSVVWSRLMLTRNLFAVANLVIEMERGYGNIAVVSRGLPAGVSMTTSHSTGGCGMGLQHTEIPW